MAGYDDLDNQSFMSSQIPRNQPNEAAALMAQSQAPPQPRPTIGSMPKYKPTIWDRMAEERKRPRPYTAPHPSFVPGAPMNIAPRSQPTATAPPRFTPEDQKRFDEVWNSKAPLAPERDENAQLAARAHAIDPGWHPPGEQPPRMGPMGPTGPRGPIPRSPMPAPNAMLTQAMGGKSHASPMAVQRLPLLSREQAMQIAQQRPPQSPMSMQPVPVPQPATPIVATQRAAEPQAADEATYAAGASKSPEAAPTANVGTPPDTRGQDILRQLDTRRAKTDALRQRVMEEGMRGGNGFSANVVNPILSGLLHDKMASDYLSKDSENKNRLDQEGRQQAMQAANAQNASDHEAINDYEHLDPFSTYNRRIEESLKKGDIAEATRLHFYQIQAQHAERANALKEHELQILEQHRGMQDETAAQRARIAELEAEIRGRHVDNQHGENIEKIYNTAANNQTVSADKHYAVDQAGVRSSNIQQQTNARTDKQIEAANRREADIQQHTDTRFGQGLQSKEEQHRLQRLGQSSVIDPKTGQPKNPAGIQQNLRPFTAADAPRARQLAAQYKLSHTPEGNAKLQQLLQSEGIRYTP